MPPAALRFTLEGAFLVLVALGAGLAELDPLVIVALIALASVLVAFVEWASARGAGRAFGDEQVEESPVEAVAEPPKDAEPASTSPVAASAPEPQLPPEPEPAVNERSARAILASASPPSAEPPPPPALEFETEVEPGPAAPLEPESQPEPKVEPEPEPDTDAEPAFGGPPREWNVWELQRLARERPEDPRHEEWVALALSLRDFARADGTLAVEFDDLVRESFGGLLLAQHTTETVSAV